MTLEQLRVFAAVAARLHMTRAAEALNMTQSAASAAIAALEARHGVRLFDRVGRGLALTQAGRTFLPDAEAVLARAQVAAQALDDLAGVKRGAITLAASQTVANYWLPSRMAAFVRAYPDITLKLMIGNTSQVAMAVMEGVADIGFVEGDIGRQPLVRSRIANDRIAVYAAPSHPLAGAMVGPGDLESALWARREVGSGTRSESEDALADKGVDPGKLRTALELTSNEAVLEATASGGLVAAVSELAARPFVAQGRLQKLQFDLPDRYFDLVTHPERNRSAAVEAFLNQL